MFPVGLNIQICVHNISIILVCACVHRDYWCFEAFVDVKIPGAGDDLTMCKWVWEREANINWSMVICQGSTRSELP